MQPDVFVREGRGEKGEGRGEKGEGRRERGEGRGERFYSGYECI
jgi:hypothetical protein